MDSQQQRGSPTPFHPGKIEECDHHECIARVEEIKIKTMHPIDDVLGDMVERTLSG